MEGKNPILIVYFSRDGHSEKITNDLVEKLNCESIRVEESIDRSGFMAYVRGIGEAFLGTDNSMHMKTVFNNIEQYKSIIFVGPVWCAALNAPIKNACNEIVKQISATQHNAGDETSFNQFKSIFNGKAITHEPYLPCNKSLYASGALEEKIQKFIEDILATLN
ncbi:Flavodoxin-like domain-containing protein [Entamoeba marina]